MNGIDLHEQNRMNLVHYHDKWSEKLAVVNGTVCSVFVRITLMNCRIAS